MRSQKIIGVMVLMFLSAATAFPKQELSRIVVPVKNDVPVFDYRIHRGNETALFRAGVTDHLTVLAESRGRYEVKNGNGKTGWIDKTSVKNVKPSKRFVFDNADVLGYLDDPTPLYIIDADDPEQASIKLDRSFADALRENVDRFTIERMAGVYPGGTRF